MELIEMKKVEYKEMENKLWQSYHENHELKNQNEWLKDQLKKLEQKIEELKSEVQRCNQKNHVLKGIRQQVESCTRQVNKNLQERLDQTDQKSTLLQQKINVLTEENNKLKRENKLQKEEFTEENNKLKREIKLQKEEEHKRQVDSLRNEFEQLNLQSDGSVPCIPRRRTAQEEEITTVIFGSPVRRTTAVNEFACPYACMLHSLVRNCRHENIPVCVLSMIKKAVYSIHPQKLLDCKNTADLLTKFGVITHVTYKNIQNLAMLNETFATVIQNVKGNVGVLAFDYHNRSIGHGLSFEKVGNQLKIWDAQKKDWWSEDDYKTIKNVHCFEVNTEVVISLSATCDCLSGLIQPMEMCVGIPESNLVSQDHRHTGSRSDRIKRARSEATKRARSEAIRARSDRIKRARSGRIKRARKHRPCI